MPAQRVGGECQHRYSAPHHINKDRSKWLRTCRNCDIELVSWFDEEMGRIVEKVDKFSILSSPELKEE